MSPEILLKTENSEKQHHRFRARKEGEKGSVMQEEKKGRSWRTRNGEGRLKGKRDDIAMECESNCSVAAEIRLGKVR